jgi:hypothetical protein
MVVPARQLVFIFLDGPIIRVSRKWVSLRLAFDPHKGAKRIANILQALGLNNVVMAVAV